MTAILLRQSSYCSVAAWRKYLDISTQIPNNRVYAIGSPRAFIHVAWRLPYRSVDHLVIIGQCGPTWIFDPDAGLTMQNVNNFAFAWSRVLVKEPKISLIIGQESLAPVIKDALGDYCLHSNIEVW